MKCSSCGNTKLVKADFPMRCYNGSPSVAEAVKTYLCLKCGHYEFFSTEKIAAYQEKATEIKDMENELDSLHQQLELALSKQKEWEEAHPQEMKKRIRCVPDFSSNELKRKIQELEPKLRSLKYDLEQGKF